MLAISPYVSRIPSNRTLWDLSLRRDDVNCYVSRLTIVRQAYILSLKSYILHLKW